MPQDFDLDQFKTTYFEECQELLTSAEEYLGELQNNVDDVDVEVLHAVFRCVHSIKGGAGAFNFTELVRFSHVFETLLDRLRSGQIHLSLNLLEVILEALDVLANLVQRAKDEEDDNPALWQSIAQKLEFFTESSKDKQSKAPRALTEKIKPFDGYNKTDQEEEEQGWGLFIDEDDAVFDNSKNVASTQVSESDDSSPIYKIEFVPDVHLLRFANEPLLLARELKTLGECDVQINIDRLPTLDKIKSDEAYLSWTYILRTERCLQDIEEVFEFVVDDCQLSISRLNDVTALPEKKKSQKSTARVKPKKEIKEPKAAVVNTLTPTSSVPLEDLVQKQDFVSVTTDPTYDVPNVEKSKIDLSTNVNQQSKVNSIRVELDRVDKLVNMVGELVITQAMLKQQSEELANGLGNVMAQGFEDLSAHTRELQESVMAIRMQPVKSVFSRMPRLVRELSSKLDKKIDLVTEGEMTEVDKTVIEQLMDPLTHMIRNSVDHGIETFEERKTSGKSERATIYLSAEHRSGRIQIEVIDDGRGINRKRVLEKAIEQGIISSNHDLLDEQIDELIFAPGFSTVDVVSDVSGRGVGMDVVKRNILSLGGRISVFSKPGQGTRFLLSLPLTLAVLDGMIIQCGTEKYIIPLTSVMETIRPIKEEINQMVNGSVLVSVRGEYIRLVHLYRLFNIKGSITDISKALVVIVDTDRYGFVGIVVDELLGQQQVVIKSIEENHDPIAGVSAATILGNGKVGLILDVDGLAEMEHGDNRYRPIASIKQQQVLLMGDQAHGLK